MSINSCDSTIGTCALGRGDEELCGHQLLDGQDHTVLAAQAERRACSIDGLGGILDLRDKMGVSAAQP